MMQCYFTVCQKADISQLNLLHGINSSKKWRKKFKKVKMDKLRSIGKQPQESVEWVTKKKKEREATVGRIWQLQRRGNACLTGRAV